MNTTEKQEPWIEAAKGIEYRTGQYFPSVIERACRKHAANVQADLDRMRSLIDLNARIESEFVDGSPEKMVAEICKLQAAKEALFSTPAPDVMMATPNQICEKCNVCAGQGWYAAGGPDRPERMSCTFCYGTGYIETPHEWGERHGKNDMAVVPLSATPPFSESQCLALADRLDGWAADWRAIAESVKKNNRDSFQWCDGRAVSYKLAAEEVKKLARSLTSDVVPRISVTPLVGALSAIQLCGSSVATSIAQDALAKFRAKEAR